MNWVNIDAGRRDGYKDGVPEAGFPHRPGSERFHLLERSLDTEEQVYSPLVEPAALKRDLPAPHTVRRTVSDAREAIKNILMKADSRLLVIAGPCSIKAMLRKPTIKRYRRQMTGRFFWGYDRT
jgi:hypothetical protein